jgi:hypothetical protein
MMSRTIAIDMERGFYTVAREQGKQRPQSPKSRSPERAAADPSGGTLNTIPEMVRRIVGMGLSGFFLTEEAIRKAIGDTLPKDWADFAVDQSERTRREFMDRLTSEIGRSLENVDLATVLATLMEGRTVEIKAEFRLKPDRSIDASGLSIDTPPKPRHGS